MPDCHSFCADLTQAREEALRRFKLSKQVLQEIGLSEDDYELTLRFTSDFFNENKEFIGDLVKLHGKPAFAEMWNEKFFYFIFKWEFNFIDNQGKSSALSTDQIDVENGERYGITFVDAGGVRRHPIILHNSPSGAIERCIFALP